MRRHSQFAAMTLHLAPGSSIPLAHGAAPDFLV